MTNPSPTPDVPLMQNASRHRFGFACIFLFVALALAAAPARAQDNYEIQVYDAETVAPGHTMVELHSNFTLDGSKTMVDGLEPTQHAFHETIEITHGFTGWFETGFYIFTSA